MNQVFASWWFIRVTRLSRISFAEYWIWWWVRIPGSVSVCILVRRRRGAITQPQWVIGRLNFNLIIFLLRHTYNLLVLILIFLFLFLFYSLLLYSLSFIFATVFSRNYSIIFSFSIYFLTFTFPFLSTVISISPSLSVL